VLQFNGAHFCFSLTIHRCHQRPLIEFPLLSFRLILSYGIALGRAGSLNRPPIYQLCRRPILGQRMVRDPLPYANMFDFLQADPQANTLRCLSWYRVQFHHAQILLVGLCYRFTCGLWRNSSAL